MVNFVLNSLAGGGTLDMVLPLVLAVVFTLAIVALDALMKPIKPSAAEEDSKQ